MGGNARTTIDRSARADRVTRRRGSPRPVLGLVVALVAALVVTSVAATPAGAVAGARPVCGTPTANGVDVSANQGTVTWPAVAASGRTFAYAKALDGIGNRDASFVTNYQGIKAAGMKAGAYLFFRGWANADTQADVFIDRLQEAGYAAGDLVPVIDVELDTASTSPPVSTATYVANLRTVEARLQAAIGTPPVIYTNPDFWATRLGDPAGFSDNPLWIAHYGVACPEVPDTWSTWRMWQHTDAGSVPGIVGAADLDRLNGSLPLAPSVAPAFLAASPPTTASEGTPYTYRFRASGVPTPTYSIASGSLPPGITLDPASGALSGAPTDTGTYSFNVRASNGIGVGPLSSALPLTIQVAPPAAGFHSMVPYRVLDSRLGTGWSGMVSAGADRSLTVTGASGVPATASSVVMNVTVVDSTAASFLTVYPDGVELPNASNLNFGAGQIIPNLVTVRMGPGGVVKVANAVGATHVVADIVGWYDDGSPGGELFNDVAPTRILDSRTTTGGWPGKIGAGDASVRTLQVTGGSSPVPDGATSVVMNVTVTEGSALSFLQVWPEGTTRPNSSNLNAAPGQTIPNLVTVKLSPAGAVSFFNAAGSSHVIADVVGWYGATGTRFHSLPTPTRIADSRIAVGLAGRIWSQAAPPSLTVTGRNGIPLGATGLVANVTVADSDSESFLSVIPGNQGVTPRPTSNLNFGRNQVIPNLVAVRLPTTGPGAGQVKVFNAVGLTYVIIDAVGYFAP